MIRLWLSTCVLAASFGLPAASMERCSASTRDHCVVDGDTLVLKSRRIRIANIDAPELEGAQCEAERRLAVLATRRLTELLDAGPIKVIEGDPASGRVIDRHGRTLALVEVGGRDIGAALVKGGYARPWVGKRLPWC